MTGQHCSGKIYRFFRQTIAQIILFLYNCLYQKDKCHILHVFDKEMWNSFTEYFYDRKRQQGGGEL
ncbi:MAG TPA: hypothetical protein DCS74_01980 [Veillonellaceae bacterium]|nr:hypothetical protein [Veillonellaceae bacterium]